MKPAVGTRLFVDGTLATGKTIEIGRARAHYLRDVLRLSPGAPLRLFNGCDGEWRAAVATLAKTGGTLAVEARTREQAAEPDLWLVFAPVKRAAIDLIAEKATELGVSRLQPVMTRHAHVDRVNIERLGAIAMAAAEQCERLTLPVICNPVALAELLAQWPLDRRLLVCAEGGEARPIGEALSAFGRVTIDVAGAILTGPEGGFDRAELDALRKSPFAVAVGLGPRILRAETAAMAAIACWQAMVGDGARQPPLRGAAD